MPELPPALRQRRIKRITENLKAGQQLDPAQVSRLTALLFQEELYEFLLSRNPASEPEAPAHEDAPASENNKEDDDHVSNV